MVRIMTKFLEVLDGSAVFWLPISHAGDWRFFDASQSTQTLEESRSVFFFRNHDFDKKNSVALTISQILKQAFEFFFQRKDVSCNHSSKPKN